MLRNEYRDRPCSELDKRHEDCFLLDDLLGDEEE